MAVSTNQRIGGVAQLSIDGASITLAGSFSWSPSNVKREIPRSMSTPVPGYTETLIPATISFEGFDYSSTALSSYQDMVEVVLVCQLGNGKVITGQNMICMDAVEANAVDGTIKLHFEGPSITEALSA